jgi:ribose transport system substrate-binding protein
MKNMIWVVLFAVLAGVFIVIGVMRKGQDSTEIRIAVIPKETASVYWESVRQGALKAGEEEKVKIFWNGPEIETDRERQIQIIEDFLAQQVNGIVLAPNDRKALVPAVEKIFARNIPCVIVDSAVEVDEDKYLSYMATDNYQGGVMAAQRLGKILGGKGKVILVEWTPNSASTDARAEGFRATLAKEFTDIELIDSKYPNPPTVAQAREVTEDMLTKNPEVHGIFACNATTAAGALQALRSPGQAERGIKMVGFDAWDMLVDGLKSGELDSLVIQNPYRMGYEGVKAIVRKLEGKDVAKKVDTGVELVTKDRLTEPNIKTLLNLQ